MENQELILMTPERYLEERVKQYQSWYDNKSVKAKSYYLRMRAASVIGGAIVPVLVNITLPYINIVTTFISLLVVILVSLESVFHYREQWKNYRSTEQYIVKEQMYYFTRIGPYNNLNDTDAFHLFVDRVEAAINNENNATLNIMTMASEVKEDKG